MTWLNSSRNSYGSVRHEWYSRGHVAYRTGHARSISDMPEANFSRGEEMAWMMGFLDAFMQDVRGSVRVQDDFNQVVNESLVHPLHRGTRMTDETRAVSPVLDRLLQDAERAYRERASPPADEPEVVNPGTRKRRMIEV